MNRKKLIKSEVCHLFNVSKEFLRHYENKGLLNPEVSDTHYRFYDYEDLQRIRELLLLRDLDFSISDMQKIRHEPLETDEFKNMLIHQQQSMIKKVKHLQHTLNDITQLLELLEKNESISFLEKSYEDRYFFLTNSSPSSLKDYYNDYQSIIEDISYSERHFQMIYQYDNLSIGETFEGQVAVESSEDNHHMILPSGDYLSVFFPFEHGNFRNLEDVKSEIENYLKTNNLKRVNKQVLELEHPELSLFTEPNTTIFELQLKIERIL